MPRMDINVALGELQAEVDVTLIDRINTLITPEKIATPNNMAAASMYHTVGVSFLQFAVSPILSKTTI